MQVFYLELISLNQQELIIQSSKQKEQYPLVSQKGTMKKFVKAFSQENNLFRIVFFQFLIDQVNFTRQVCKQWQKKVSEIFQEDLNMIKSKFQSKYSSVFTIQQMPNFTFNQQAVIYKTPDARKINIDFFLKLHLKQNYEFEEDSKYTISYSYQLSSSGRRKMLRSSKKAKKYFWKLQFEYIGEENTQKTVWMYKDYKSEKCYESDNEALVNEKQIDEDSIPYIMDCQPVRRSQIVQIRLPYCVRNNLVDLTKLDFYSIEEQAPEKLSTIERFFQQKLTNSRRSSSNNCYIQTLYEWKKYDYFRNPISFQLDDAINCYKNELQMQEISINNLEDHFRIEFECKKPLKESKFMGHVIEILPVSNKYLSLNNLPIVQLKRKGIYEENKKKITFRVGDKLLLYLCDLKDQ